MFDIKRLARQSVLATLLLSVAACGANSVMVKPTPGTAQKLSGLELQTDVSPTLVYIRPDAPTLAAYSRFIIDPVQINYSDPSMRELKYEDITRMQQYFQRKMVEELRDGGYEVGTRTQPGSMRISLSIVGMKAPSAAGNVTAVLAPISISVGEVTVEAVFSEATSKRIDAVVIDRSRGSMAFNSKPWSTWADVESAFNTWAKGVRKAVDEAHEDDD